MRYPLNRRKGKLLPREEWIYNGPLVLLKKSPGCDRKKGHALLATDNVVFNESYYGYSTRKSKNPGILTAYFHLLAQSNLWRYYSLMTSSEFAVERRVFQKNEIDGFPFFQPEDLSRSDIAKVKQLSAELIGLEVEENQKVFEQVFEKIDSFFGNLYGLNDSDTEVIAETIETCMPYKESRERASDWPSALERETFCSRLAGLLQPFFGILNEQVVVNYVPPNGDPIPKLSPYGYIMLYAVSKQPEVKSAIIREMQNLAWSRGQSLIVQRLGGGLLIGILNEYRYWTKSAARLLARDIVRRYLDEFPLPHQNFADKKL